MNIPMKPQKNIQFGYRPIPHEMHVPTATKTDGRRKSTEMKLLFYQCS